MTTILNIKADIAQQNADNAMLDDIQEMAEFGIWQINLDDYSVYWSDNSYDIHGVCRKSFSPNIKNIVDFYNHQDQSYIQKYINDAIDNRIGSKFSSEFQISLANEQIRYVKVNAKCKNNKIFGVYIDVTDRNIIERELKNIKRRYDIAINGSMVGLWDWDVKKDKLFWSPRLLEILGIKDKNVNLKYDDFLSRIYSDDLIKVKNALNMHLKHNIQYNIEYRMMHEEGYYIWVRDRGKAIWDDNGDVVRVAGTIDDVSVQKNYEEELIESRNFQKLIMDSNPDLIYVKDKDFCIIDANPAFLSAYPESMRNRIIGRTTMEEFSDEAAEEILAYDQKAFDSGESENYETITFPDGVKRSLITQKIRFENAQGQEFILGISRDVTERDNLIDKLNRSNKELEDFSYITAHDMKEPLRGIYNHVQFLIRDYGDKFDENAHKRLERLSYLTKHMERLISDLLFFSRLDKVDLAIEKTNLNDLVNEIISCMPLEEENIKITIKENLPVMICDKVRIKEVFRNLIVNAVNYNESNQKIISIGIDGDLSKQYHTPVIYVKDNGIGIEPKFYDEIFRMFKHLNKREKYNSGSGAGLTIVKKIIENHGGSIWLSSEQGKGTIFYFTLKPLS